MLETTLINDYWSQTGSHPVDIQRISAGGICDFPALDYCGFYAYAYDITYHIFELFPFDFIVLPPFSQLGDFFLNSLLHDGNNKK